jgi:argininosuccinate lyase
VSRAVRECLDGGFALETFPLENYRKISDAFDQDLYAALTLDAILSARDVRGGTSRRAVKAALARARASLRSSPASARAGRARAR